MAARESLRVFLTKAKTSLRTAIEKKSNITFVIGNESADLDSITSSIVYAYLRSNQPKCPLHIPLLNIPKADLSLRPELLALLPHANISRDHLLTLDDLPSTSSLESHLPPPNTRWILVDHNVLQGQLGTLYSDRVIGCIDHHADEGKISPSTDPDSDDPCIITVSGSCTSLVVNHCHSFWPSPSSSSSPPSLHSSTAPSDTGTTQATALYDAQLARFALASILIDTHNLLDSNKTTTHDTKAVTLLESIIAACPSTSSSASPPSSFSTSATSTVPFSRNAFFDEINRAKSDTDGIPLQGLLRKDYKAWSEGNRTLGISSVVRSLGYLVRKAGKEGSGSGEGEGQSTEDGIRAEDPVSQALLDTARKFAEERGLDVFAIMTAFPSAANGEFARQLLVTGRSEGGKAAIKRFSDACAEKLGLEDMSHDYDGDDGLRIWDQKDVKASRKQVAPMLREAMKSE